MTRLALLALLLWQGALSGESSLSASLEKARSEFALSRAAAQQAEAEATPLADTVRQLKAVENPWWWTRWRLRRKLGQLQESLDTLRLRRVSYEKSRQDLFLVLSALEEELRSALNRELQHAHASRPKVQQLFVRKGAFDRELEAMGFGEGKPFPLVEAGQALSPSLRADRQKALQARAIQLEAWSETVREDLRLLRRARDSGAMDAALAAERLKELEDLSTRISVMVRDNEKQLLSKN